MDQLLKAAAGVSSVWTLAAFAIAVLVYYLGQRKGRVPPIAWGVLVAVVLLGLVPIVGSFYVQVVADSSVYVVRVNVVDATGGPVLEAQVTNSLGTYADKKAGAWQFEIPKQTRPADGRVTIYAVVTGAFQKGSADVVLGADMHPSVSVVLKAAPDVKVLGSVQDDRGHKLAGVRVSIEGHGESVLTDAAGSFSLPAHAPDGQQVTVHAEKAGFEPATILHLAGEFPAQIVLRKGRH